MLAFIILAYSGVNFYTGEDSVIVCVQACGVIICFMILRTSKILFYDQCTDLGGVFMFHLGEPVKLIEAT